VNGNPDRLGKCEWVSNARLVAVNSDSSNPKLLSTKSNLYTRGIQLGGGDIIDWLPEQEGAALMTRTYLPDGQFGSRVGSASLGVGVDWIDTRNVEVKRVEPARSDALLYISDGRGVVRIMGLKSTRHGGGQDTSKKRRTGDSRCIRSRWTGPCARS
jgi:hypothetical protein